MPNSPYLLKTTHEEFAKRVEAENKRTSRRLEAVEGDSKNIADLVASVSSLATSIKSMQEELKEQGSSIRKLESKDGEMWRNVVGYVVTAVIGVFIGFITSHMGM